MTTWEHLIQGKYCNKRQAQSNPALWPHIVLRNSLVSDNVIELKSWYNYQSEAEVYGHFHLTFRYDEDGNVHTTTINQKTGEPACPWVWGYNLGYWWGEPDGKCIIGNNQILSQVRFNGKVYLSRDTALDKVTGEFRWGKPLNESGEFEFIRHPD